jgi:hypothetical protein
MAALYPHILKFPSFGATETPQLIEHNKISYGPI